MIQKIVIEPKNYEIGILFTAGGREFKIGSNDKPESSFWMAVADVVFTSRPCLSYPQGEWMLKSIAFTNAGTVLALKARVHGGEARLTLPAISSKPVEKSTQKGNMTLYELDMNHPRNIFNEKVKTLIEKVEAFLYGEGMQKAFNFGPEFEDSRLREAVQ